MKTLYTLLCCGFLFANDAPQLPTKKEAIPVIPHVWASGSMLLLQAEAPHAAYANRAQTIGLLTNYQASPSTDPHFEWNFGVRLNMGYQPRDLMTEATWTFVQNYAHGDQTTDGTMGFSPVLSINNSPTNYVTSAFFQWKTELQIVDLGVSGAWEFRDHLSLRPHAALRGFYLGQRYSAEYGGGLYDAGIDSVVWKNNYFGMGPTLGLVPSIMMGKGLSLTGDIAGSLLYGAFFLRQDESYLQTSLRSTSTNQMKLTWTFDAKAALAWQMELYRTIVLSVQTGWEWHTFYRQERLPSLANIDLQGGFLSFTVGF